MERMAEETNEAETQQQQQQSQEAHIMSNEQKDPSDYTHEANASTVKNDEGNGNNTPQQKEEEETRVVKLGPKVFHDSVEMFSYFFNLLHTWPLNINFNKFEHIILKDLLIMGHREANKKIGPGLKAFQVRVHPQWESRCFCVIRTDDAIDDFSYRKCIHSLIPLPDNMKVSGDISVNGNIDRNSREEEEGNHFGSHERQIGNRSGRGRGHFHRNS